MFSSYCAHSKIIHKPFEHADGSKTDRWICKDCGHLFTPLSKSEEISLRTIYIIKSSNKPTTYRAVLDGELIVEPDRVLEDVMSKVQHYIGCQYAVVSEEEYMKINKPSNEPVKADYMNVNVTIPKPPEGWRDVGWRVPEVGKDIIFDGEWGRTWSFRSGENYFCARKLKWKPEFGEEVFFPLVTNRCEKTFSTKFSPSEHNPDIACRSEEEAKILRDVMVEAAKKFKGEE